MHRMFRCAVSIAILFAFLAAAGVAQITGFVKRDDGPARPGEVIVYRVEPNEPIISTIELTFIETVPEHTVFDASASDPIWEAAGCPDGASAGTVCAVTLLLGSGGGIPEFAVRVASPLPAGVDTVQNTVMVETASATFTASRHTAIEAEPDLGIMKDEEGTTGVPNGTIRYGLAYTNDGNQDATGVVIEETVPKNTVFDGDDSTPGWSCADGALAGSPCILTIGSVSGAGGGGVSVFAVTVDAVLPAGVESISNTATIRDDGTNGPDPNPSNNTSTDLTPLSEGAAPDLVIANDDEERLADPGATIVYRLAYANDGTQAATGVELIETVPDHTAFEADGSAAGWSCVAGAPAGSLCMLEVGSLAGGGGAGSATFAVTVDDFLPAGLEAIVNSATIRDDGTNGADLNSDNNHAVDQTPLSTNAAPDLVISKDDVGTSASPGSLIRYELMFGNDGSQGSTGVVVEEDVPENTVFEASSSTAGWTCADQAPAGTPCALDIGTLDAGVGTGRAIFAVRVEPVLPAGVETIANSAVIRDDGTNGPDLEPRNNRATDRTPLSEGAAPDLVIELDDRGTATSPGSTLVYLIDVRNDGTQAATGVRVEAAVPEHTVFLAGAVMADWSCDDGAPSGTVCVLDLQSLAGGGGSTSAALGVRVDSVLPPEVKVIETTAHVLDDGSNGPDLNPANNRATDTTPLIEQKTAPDLLLTKDDGGVTVAPGDAIAYNLGVANVGTQIATGVVIREHVPAHTRFDASTSSPGWTCPPNAPGGTRCALEVGTVEAGGTMITLVTFAVTVDDSVPAGTTLLSNTAAASDDGSNGPDLEPGNNAATDETPIIVPVVDVRAEGAAAYQGWPRLALRTTVSVARPTVQGIATRWGHSTTRDGFKADRDELRVGVPEQTLVRVVATLDGEWEPVEAEPWDCQAGTCERLVMVGDQPIELELLVDRIDGPSPWHWQVEAWPVTIEDTLPDNNVDEGLMPVFSPAPGN